MKTRLSTNHIFGGMKVKNCQYLKKFLQEQKLGGAVNIQALWRTKKIGSCCESGLPMS